MDNEGGARLKLEYGACGQRDVKEGESALCKYQNQPGFHDFVGGGGSVTWMSLFYKGYANHMLFRENLFQCLVLWDKQLNMNGNYN